MEADQIDSNAGGDQKGKNLNPPVALKSPSKQVVTSFLKSTSSMAIVTEFLTVHKMINM